MKIFASWSEKNFQSLLATGLLAGILALNFPAFARHWRGMIVEASNPRTTMFLDEAASATPTLRVYEEGYLGYRCLASPWTVCYGGSQNLLDGAVLKLMPQSWLRSGPLHPTPGIQFPWMFRFPNVGTVLLWIRVLNALGMLILITAWARGLGHLNWLGALSVTISLGSSEPFLRAWIGIKNDYPSSLWAMAYFGMLLKTLSLSPVTQDPKRRRLWTVLTLAVGAFGVGVRPSVLPILGVGTLATLWPYISNPLQIMGFGALGLSVYLASNPSFWVSGAEFKWLTAYSGASRRVPSASALLREIPVALLALAPAFAVGLLKPTGPRRRLWITATLSLLALVALLVKSSYNNFYYYLPILACSWMMLLFFARQVADSRRNALAWILVGLTALHTVERMNSPVTEGRSWWNFSPHYVLNKPDASEDLVHMIASRSEHFLVDSALRPPIPEELFESGRIQYFDSLSQGPAEVLGFVKTGQPTLIATTCWRNEIPKDPLSASPAALEWAAALDSVGGKLCSYRPKLSWDAVRPYFSGTRQSDYTTLEPGQLKSTLAGHPTADLASRLPHPLNPRFLEGSNRGAERWDGQYFFDHSFAVGLSLGVIHAPLTVTVKAQSTCREQGELQAAALAGDRPHATAQSSLATMSMLLNYYPWIGRLPDPLRDGLAHWINRTFPVKPLELRISPSKLPVVLAIVGTLDGCAVGIENLELKP